MPWPSTLSSFTDPNASDRLNSPSHSSVESAQNTGLEEIQAFLGTLSSTAGTLIYDVRATASDGGGHVQVANKGGTGQTAYTKGDIIVATSASALTKLAVGADNLTLRADSSVAAGIKWADAGANKIYVNNLQFNLGSALGVTSNFFSTSILGSTLGSNNAVRTTTYFQNYRTEAASMVAAYKYAGNIVASVSLSPTTAGSVFGTITHTMIASTVSLQKHLINVNLIGSPTGGSESSTGVISFNPINGFSPASINTVITGQVYSTSSVESSATQNYEGTLQIMTGNGTSVSIAGTIVEKIVP